MKLKGHTGQDGVVKGKVSSLAGLGRPWVSIISTVNLDLATAQLG